MEALLSWLSVQALADSCVLWAPVMIRHLNNCKMLKSKQKRESKCMNISFTIPTTPCAIKHGRSGERWHSLTLRTLSKSSENNFFSSISSFCTHFPVPPLHMGHFLTMLWEALSSLTAALPYSSGWIEHCVFVSMSVCVSNRRLINVLLSWPLCVWISH